MAVFTTIAFAAAPALPFDLKSFCGTYQLSPDAVSRITGAAPRTVAYWAAGKEPQRSSQQKIREMGPYTASAQLFQNPIMVLVLSSSEALLRKTLAYFSIRDERQIGEIKKALKIVMLSMAQAGQMQQGTPAEVGGGPQGAFPAPVPGHGRNPEPAWSPDGVADDLHPPDRA